MSFAWLLWARLLTIVDVREICFSLNQFLVISCTSKDHVQAGIFILSTYGIVMHKELDLDLLQLITNLIEFTHSDIVNCGYYLKKMCHNCPGVLVLMCHKRPGVLVLHICTISHYNPNGNPQETAI